MDRSVFARLLNRPTDSNKYDYGHVLVIGGSPGMVGAPFLSASAALRVGAGLVTIASTPEVIDKLEERVVELMTLRLPEDNPVPTLKSFIRDRKVSVIVFGPGIKPEFASKMLGSHAAFGLPVIIDGGALTALAAHEELFASNFILTPHAGEFKRFSDSNDDPADFAHTHDVVLVLKGQPTRVFGQDGESYENTTGGPALATAGTGDTLTGLIAGIIAQKIKPFEACKAAVYLGGLASDLAAADKTVAGVIASDIIELIPQALKASR